MNAVGILAYSIDLGGPHHWRVAETGPEGELTTDWYTQQDTACTGFSDAVRARLLTDRRFTPSTRLPDFETVRVFDTATHVFLSLVPHGPHDRPAWQVSACTLAATGCGVAPLIRSDGVLEPGSPHWVSRVSAWMRSYFENRGHRHGMPADLRDEIWARAIGHAVEALGVTPTDPVPVWSLAVVERTAP